MFMETRAPRVDKPLTKNLTGSHQKPMLFSVRKRTGFMLSNARQFIEMLRLQNLYNLCTDRMPAPAADEIPEYNNPGARSLETRRRVPGFRL